METVTPNGVVLTKPFLNWLSKEQLGYACRVVNDDGALIPVITFSDDRDSLIYREKRNPLTIELARSLHHARSATLTDEFLEWLRANKIKVHVEAIDLFQRAYSSGFKRDPKRVFLTFSKDRDFIVFKLRWL